MTRLTDKEGNEITLIDIHGSEADDVVEKVELVVSSFLFVTSAQKANASLASASKFLGDVIGSSVPSNFNTYWNQVTPENSTKWGSVEGTRNTMNWTQGDHGL